MIAWESWGDLTWSLCTKLWSVFLILTGVQKKTNTGLNSTQKSVIQNYYLVQNIFNIVGKGLILRRRWNHVFFLELRRDCRVTTGNSGNALAKMPDRLKAVQAQLENLALCCLLYEPHSNLPFKFCLSKLNSPCPTSQNSLRLAALSEKPKKSLMRIQKNGE